MTEQTEREVLEALRNCDLIGGMDYLETCQFCAGEGIDCHAGLCTMNCSSAPTIMKVSFP